jgi:hypothetical protein
LSTKFPHLINLQRPLVLELAVAHFEPAGIGINYVIANGPTGLRDSSYLLSESLGIAVAVIATWRYGRFSALGEWPPGTPENPARRDGLLTAGDQSHEPPTMVVIENSRTGRFPPGVTAPIGLW